jgi:predicted HD phosphohydrolase
MKFRNLCAASVRGAEQCQERGARDRSLPRASHHRRLDLVIRLRITPAGLLAEIAASSAALSATIGASCARPGIPPPGRSVVEKTVSFRAMKDGTREDYQLLEAAEREYARDLPARILAAMRALEYSLQGYQLTRLSHSLQAATRARADGAEDELVVAALLHDMCDELAPYSHAQVAAAILRPYVRPEVTWIVEQHGLMQTYYYAHHTGCDRNARERLRGHIWFDACASFCERWDQASFDPDYPGLPLAAFEPVVQRIFSREAYDTRYPNALAGGLTARSRSQVAVLPSRSVDRSRPSLERTASAGIGRDHRVAKCVGAGSPPCSAA